MKLLHIILKALGASDPEDFSENAMYLLGGFLLGLLAPTIVFGIYLLA